ncbi:MAG: ferrochelatase [Leptospira sp.]|nr:ferrochelatase [Leptospira sp.]
MKKKVLLINLGGPRNSGEIEKFLIDLFTDPLVFDLPLPEFIRFRLARYIALKRAPRVAATYASMGFGGGSPIVSETEKQAFALRAALEKKTGSGWEVNITMACGYPDIRTLSGNDLTPSINNILLPLFPHFSRSTTMSVASIIEKITGVNPTGKKGWVGPFYSDAYYLESLNKLIVGYFSGNLQGEFLHSDVHQAIPDWQNVSLVFSAHGIPIRLIKKGDPYRTQVESNVETLLQLLRKSGFRGESFLSFQSRVGPSKWTEPNTIDMLQKLGRDGHKRVAIYPISFVSDHLETLEEIGVQFRDIAYESGIRDYYRIPAPGCYAPFIDALADLVLKEAEPERI